MGWGPAVCSSGLHRRWCVGGGIESPAVVNQLSVNICNSLFTVMFAADGLVIDEHKYAYGELVTAFLNYDCAGLFALVPALKDAGDVSALEHDQPLAERANALIRTMPLFCDCSDWHSLLNVD